MSDRPLLDLCIAGHWRPGSGEVYETCYPATGEPVAALLHHLLRDVDREAEGVVQGEGELAAASRALAGGGLRGTRAPQRRGDGH